MALLLTAPLTAAEPLDGDEPSAEELVFLLQYVAGDYGNAVHDGRIVDAFEYREMRVFGRLLLDRFDELRRAGASGERRTELAELLDLIRRTAPADDVRDLASGLVASLLDELNLAMLPTATPDLDRGEELFLPHCASCHGPTGAGDGPAALGLQPPPASFRGPRMNLLSPHQIQGTVWFGIDGTAMVSFRELLTREEIWDVAFFVLTLRDDFDPRRPESELLLTLDDLAARSNEELLSRARRDRPDAEPEHIDHYRRNPPRAIHPTELLAGSEDGAPWMGLSVLEMDAAARRLAGSSGPAELPTAGVWVSEVVFAGPASDAGVETGDFLVSIEGEPIGSVAQFRTALSRLRVGTTVGVGIFREAETYEFPVAIEPHPASLLAP